MTRKKNGVPFGIFELKFKDMGLRRFLIISVFTLFCFSIYLPIVSFRNYYTNSGWLYLLLLSTSLFFLIRNNSKLKLPSKNISYGTLLIFTILILTGLINGDSYIEESWLHRGIFLIILFSFMQIFSMKESLSDYLLIPLTTFTTALNIDTIYNYFINCNFILNSSHVCHSGPFKNINMFGQCLILSLPFLVYFHDQVQSKLAKFYLLFLMTMTGLSLVLSENRSALLGLSLVLGYHLHLILKRKTPAIKWFCTGTMAIVLTLGLIFVSQNSKGKPGSSSKRLAIAKISTELILENIFGLGTNNFEFGYLSKLKNSNLEFNDKEIFKHPHNEFLKLATEQGLLGSIGIWLAIFLILKISVSTLQIKDKKLTILFLLALIPELLFQFPTDMYFSVFLIAVFASFTLPKMDIANANLLTAKFIAISFAFHLTLIFMLRNSHHFNKNIQHKYSPIICNLIHDEWKMCLDHAKWHARNGDLLLAKETIKPILMRQPYNFTAIDFLYKLELVPERKKTLACLYQHISKGQKLLQKKIDTTCMPLNEESYKAELYKFLDQNYSTF